MKRSLILLLLAGAVLHTQAQAQSQSQHTNNSSLAFMSASIIHLRSTFKDKAPIYFKADRQEGAVRLIWQTSSIESFNGFEISRSVDGENFEQLSWINRQSNNTNTLVEYTYDDLNVQQNQKYLYRLKKINADGTSEYAQVEAIAESPTRKASIEVLPQTNLEQLLTIKSDTEGVIKIFNSLGHPLEEHAMKIGENTIDISYWSNGKYYVAFETATGEKILKKFYK